MRRALSVLIGIVLGAFLSLPLFITPVHAQLAGPRPIMKDVAYTTTQTGAAIWTPASGKTIVVGSVDVQCGGTTAGNAFLWFGATADTTFTQDTDQVLTYVDCGTPSATFKPWKFLPFGPTPVIALVKDYVLRITTSGNLTIHVTLYGREL